jgi:hydrogenase maturation protein HypF
MQNLSIHLLEIQHHYAHILAVKAEHNLSGKVLGFAFDGTGYGDDRTVWGGEVMVADDHRYERKYYLKPFRLLGSEKAVKEPYRSALSLLFEYFSLEEVMELDLELTNVFSKEELLLLHKVWEKGLNSPYCSSMGRVFDAVASLANISHISSFEGESGLRMEGHVDETITQSFTFSIDKGVIDLEPMIQEIIKINDTVKIVSMFFNTLVDIIVEVAFLHPELPLVFSGGVFQNKVLFQKIENRFKEMDARIYCQNKTSINDGGVSLGQAWFALHNL